MRNKVFSKMMVGGSALAMVMGLMPGIGMKSVEADTVTKNISELEEDKNGNLLVGSPDGNVVINLNEYRLIPGKLIVEGDLEIKGSDKFESSGIIVNGNLKVDKDAVLLVSSSKEREYGVVADGKIVSEGTIDILSKGHGIAAIDYNHDDLDGKDTSTDYTLEINGGKIFVNGGFWGLESDKDTVINGGDLQVDVENYGFNCEGALTISGGNINAKSEDGSITANKDISITGGNLELTSNIQTLYSRLGNIDIKGGVINATANNYSTIETATGSINISGGNVYANAKHYAINASQDLNITGGYVESNCSFEKLSERTRNILAGNNIITGDDMMISEPEGAKICSHSSYESTKYYITDAEGNIPSKIVFDKKPAPVDPDDKKDEDKKDDDQKEDSSDKKEDKSEDKKDDSKKDEKKYSNEWVDGKWYNADGTQTYKGTLSWKQNEKGWWIEDSEGWYAKNEWQKIDGKWYFFTADGYMDYSEYRDGCWLGADGAWDESYSGGHWMKDSKGWWYEDASGWYPQSQYVWIDGVQYWFGADGYWA